MGRKPRVGVCIETPRSHVMEVVKYLRELGFEVDSIEIDRSYGHTRYVVTASKEGTIDVELLSKLLELCREPIVLSAVRLQRPEFFDEDYPAIEEVDEE